MKIVSKSNSSPAGSQLPGESNPDQSKTLIETTTDHLQSETPPKSESTRDNDPVLSPFPISFILPSDTFIPPVGIRFNTVDPLASLSDEATEQLRALIQERLSKRFGVNAPILDWDIEIPFEFPLVPAEDNDHIWIRSKNEKLLPTYNSNTDDSSCSDDYDADDDETTDEEDSDDYSSQITTSDDDDDDDDELEFDKL